MKKIIASAVLAASLAFASGAFAADPPKLTLDTPIEQIVAVPAGKAVLDKDLPGVTTHAMYDQFKSMSLKDLQPMSQGAITDEALKKVGEDLAAVKP